MADHDGATARDRHARATALVAAEPDGELEGALGSLQRLCRALVQDLSVTGATVNLMSGTGSEGVAAGSDERSERIDELQFTFGEGPCHDAFASRRPVLTADLQAAATRRWPGYGPAAREWGVGAVFAFPLNVGAAGLGVLDVYADQPRFLTDEQLAMALTFAEIATGVILDGQAITTDGQLTPGLHLVLDYRSEIYQAQGMVMVQLGVSLAEALARLRAHAFASDLDLADLARDILAGRKQLELDAR